MTGDEIYEYLDEKLDEIHTDLEPAGHGYGARVSIYVEYADGWEASVDRDTISSKPNRD